MFWDIHNISMTIFAKQLKLTFSNPKIFISTIPDSLCQQKYPESGFPIEKFLAGSDESTGEILQWRISKIISENNF